METDTRGQRLRAERKRLGLDQPELAAIGGVKRVTQHLYEEDILTPDCGYLLSLTEGDVDVAYVLLGKPDDISAELDLDTFAKVYRVIDEVGVDARGKLLPIDQRSRLYALLFSYISAARPLELS